MKVRFLFLAILLFLSEIAYSQNEWTSTDDSYVQGVQQKLVYLNQAILEQKWEEAEKYLSNFSIFERWKERGLLNHPKVSELVALFESYKERIATKTSFDPSQKKSFYISLTKGHPKKGGTKENPAKFLWRVLKEAPYGSDLYISGMVYGQMGSGSETIETPHLSFHGGFNDDFSQRDPLQYPTLFSKDESAPSTSKYHILEFNASTGTILDGIIFDQKNHNKYNSQGLEIPSYGAPLVSIQGVSAGKVIIRNCVFVNGNEGGLRVWANYQSGEVLIENCIFLNCTSYGLELNGGENTKFVVRNNTFAMIHPKNNIQGRAIVFLSRGQHEITNNLFAYCDVGIDAIKNQNFNLRNNVGYFLTRGAVLCYSNGNKVTASFQQVEEEIDLPGEYEENQMLDPRLDLDPLCLMKYLKNNQLEFEEAFEKALKAKEIAKIEPLLSKEMVEDKTSVEPPVEEKKAPIEEKKEDPFADNPFSDDPFKKREDPFAKKEPEPVKPPKDPDDNSLVPTAKYNPQAYPWQKVWIFPKNTECEAGARPPKY